VHPGAGGVHRGDYEPVAEFTEPLGQLRAGRIVTDGKQLDRRAAAVHVAGEVLAVDEIDVLRDPDGGLRHVRAGSGSVTVKDTPQ
jgi:hypothetical protein